VAATVDIQIDLLTLTLSFYKWNIAKKIIRL